MWYSGIPLSCTLFVFLARLALTKPLPDWKQKDFAQNYEEEAEQVLDSLTGRMKEELIQSLNLSAVLLTEKPAMKLPQYMIDLYNQYADDRSSFPMSNVIRSFNAQDIMLSSSKENPIQSHILLFNVTIPVHEDITKAELKMKMPLGDWGLGHLSLFDVIHIEPSENLRDKNSFLSAKDVEEGESVTIDVTRAVKRWMNSKVEKNKLEFFFKSNITEDTCIKTTNAGISSDGNHLPILIIFSDDQGNRMKETRMELYQMILHEQEKNLGIFSQNITAELVEETREHHVTGKTPVASKTRVKRVAGRNYCTKTSLIVNFKDIKYDFVMFPPSYDAGQCVGECYYPLTDNVTPTKHAIIQAYMHKNKQEVASPCCVPTKLAAIQALLMLDGVPTIKTNYEGMKVVECGCR
ncbi:dorsalin-1-like [Pseudophryne corroboree]|uniref:dorsalin-1-like n=1 Tax=Pseudophryne corroboree TaxID=495146 RepID=UPI003081F425